MMTFQQAGYWRISPVVNVSYTDSPCGSTTWQGSAQVTLADITVFSVSFDTSPVILAGVNSTATVNATVAPADAAGQVTFATNDPTIATVTPSSGTSPVPLTVTGTGVGVRREKASIFSGCNSHPARGRSSR